jgi:hypothetical protein
MDQTLQEDLHTVKSSKDMISLLDNVGIYCSEKEVSQLCAYIKLQLKNTMQSRKKAKSLH